MNELISLEALSKIIRLLTSHYIIERERGHRVIDSERKHKGEAPKIQRRRVALQFMRRNGFAY